MNKTLKTILQIGLSIGLGIFLIWLVYRNFEEEDKQNMLESFQRADYTWIIISTCVAILSHIFRAWRWKYPLKQLGYNLDLGSSFSAVMIGYLFNLAFPRLGEVTRCAVLAKNQNMPFEKLFGTVIAERLVDMVVLLALIVTAFAMQVDILSGFMSDIAGEAWGKAQGMWLIAGLGLIGLVMAFFGWRFIQSSTHKIAVFAREKVQGLLTGLIALKKMENKGAFLFHTFGIWGSYVLMYWVTFRTFPETAQVGFGGILASFVLGGISLIVVQGGLGAYPAAVSLILVLYGVEEAVGYAFGWIVWTAQTVTILIAGLVSMIALPFISKNKTHENIDVESVS